MLIDQINCWHVNFRRLVPVRFNPPKPAHPLFDDYCYANIFIYFYMTLIYLFPGARLEKRSTS